MSSGQNVEIRDLDRDEIDRILDRNRIGRIGFSWQDRVSVVPIGYVHAGGWIWGRTSPGEKLVTIRHNYWVAFEVDEVEGPYDWRSVVIHGGFYLLGDDGTPADREAYGRGVKLLQGVDPAIFTDEDPVPIRTQLFRIAVQEVTGRESKVVPSG